MAEDDIRLTKEDLASFVEYFELLIEIGKKQNN